MARKVGHAAPAPSLTARLLVVLVAAIVTLVVTADAAAAGMYVADHTGLTGGR